MTQSIQASKQASKQKARQIACSTALIFSSFSVPAAQFERISVATGGGEANAESFTSRISADGRYVAFSSAASNLVANDTNKAIDIFVRDRISGTTERVSVGTGGIQANEDLEKYANFNISGDGRYVVFNSPASNLVSNDTNGVDDVFIHDRQTHTTSRVSVDSSGNQGNRRSYGQGISFNGRHVAFISGADNLVANDTNGVADAFIRDTVAGTTSRVSDTSLWEDEYSDERLETERTEISANGQVVVYSVGGWNEFDPRPFLFDVFAHDLSSKITISWNHIDSNNSIDWLHAVSSDGNFIMGINDLVCEKGNEFIVIDRTRGVTEIISVDSKENKMTAYDADMSADGKYFAFSSDDLLANFGVIVSDNSGNAIVRRDKAKGITEMVSKYPKKLGNSNGYEAFVWNETEPAISADGRFISYTTNSEELVSNDTNNVRDIYLRDMNASSTEPPTGKPRTDLVVTQTDSSDPVQSGTNLTYSVTITNQGPFDASNVKLIDTLPGKTKLVSATPSQGSCTGKSKITCKLGSLSNSASATVQLIVTPQINKKGKTYTLQNVATASATPKDPNTKNNKSIKEKTVVVP